MRSGSRRILVSLLVAGGLLAGLAWWQRPREPQAPGHAPAALQADAAGSRPSTSRAAMVRGPPRAEPHIPAIDCLAQRRDGLRSAKATMVPGASAAGAFDALLMDDLLDSLAVVEPREQARRRAIADARWQEARIRWPRNLDLAWFAARNCAPRLGCNRDAALQHLLALDGDNAAAWLLAMTYAPREADPARYDRLLQRAARARFNDPRIGTVFLHLQPILAAVPSPSPACRGDEAEFASRLGHAPTSEDWATVEASAAEMAIGFASLASLSGCNPDAGPLPPARRQDCMAVLRLVADGDTVLERTLGLSLLIRLEGDGPGAREWRERYRRLRWLTSIGGRLMERSPGAETIWLQGEVAWLQQQADAAGLWPPPPGWLPDDARGRALILTGRVPPELR